MAYIGFISFGILPPVTRATTFVKERCDRVGGRYSGAHVRYIVRTCFLFRYTLVAVPFYLSRSLLGEGASFVELGSMLEFIFSRFSPLDISFLCKVSTGQMGDVLK